MQNDITSSQPYPEAHYGQLDREIRLKELEIRRREIELPIELASLGLRGTLMGAIGGFVVLIVLAGLSVFSDKAQITGMHLCILAAIIATACVMYGAFVFQRSAQIAARYRDTYVAVGSEKSFAEVDSQKKKIEKNES
jgi:hypothetical protein